MADSIIPRPLHGIIRINHTHIRRLVPADKEELPMPHISLSARPRLGWRQIVFLLCLAVYLFVAWAGGASLPAMAAYFGCVALYLVLPGAFFACNFGPKGMGLEPLLTILYGSGFLAVVYCFAVRLGQLWLLRLVPAAVGLAFVAQLWQGRRGMPRLSDRQKGILANLALLWGVLCLLFALLMSAENPHPAAAGSVDISRDLLWNIGNGNAFQHAFPPEDIRFDNVRFSYHYLTELLTGALAILSGAESYDIFVFFSGPVFLAGELAALYCLGRCFYRDDRKKALALPVVLFGFQCASMWGIVGQKESVFGNTLLKHLVTNINSQATAVIFFSIWLALFTTMARKKFAVGPVFFGAYFGSFVLFSFSKGPQAAIMLCSMAITMVIVLLFQKPRYGRALFCLAGTGLVFFGIYQFLYASGANSSMIFSIYAMENSLPYRVLSPLADWLCAHLPISGYVWLVCMGIANAFCMLPFQFFLWLCSLPGAIRGLFKLDAGHIVAHGAVAGGLLAYHLFWHPNSSQIYFALLAMVCMTLLGVEQLDRLKKPGLLRPVALVCAGVGACTTLFMVGVYGGSGAAQLAATLGLTDPIETASNATADDEAAAVWVQQNTPADAVFATNRTSSTPDRIDGISSLYSALADRQGYMEGWTYAVSNMGVDAATVEHRRQTNDTLFSADTDPAQLEQLCDAEGIDLLIWAKNWPGEAPSGLTPAYENDSVAVYLVP